MCEGSVLELAGCLVHWLEVTDTGSGCMSADCQWFLQGHHGKQTSQNTFWLRACCVLNMSLGSLKIQSGTKLWIALNFSLRYLDFILQFTLVMKGSSIGKAVCESKHKREVISSKWPLLEYLGRMLSFSPSDILHCWNNATNLENIYLLYSRHLVRNKREAK